MTVKPICFSIGIWFLRKLQYLLGASTVGVRALIIDQHQRILLVKHTYMSGWHLPGGGVKPGETAEAAVIREIKEEAGIITQQIPKLFNVYFHTVKGVNDYPILFVITNFTQEQVYCSEIAEIDWFSINNLPEDVSLSTCSRLEEFFQNKSPCLFW